jgi:diaminohydroxyphosphoribosylaminopyrimidine deaminase / 5-amino-6-(5-phosphoribosylamino)uracil reductase
MDDDAAHMARALLLAERGRGRTSPNPMVGALVVSDEGVIVGRGSHERAGGPHAEVSALVDAGDRARGATLYCTLEPCTHTGRTGPCAPRVAEAGIRRAVIAVEDPNPRVRGRGLQHLRDHGIEVQVGVMAEEAWRLNRPFFTYIARGRPYVTLKAALSVDGMAAARRGARTALTGPEANRLVHQERAEVDAIAIGSETLLVDDPLLTARGVYRERPLVRVVFDRRLRTSPVARLFSTLDAGPVIVMSLASSRSREPARADALEGVGAQLELIEEVELDGRGEAASAAFLRGALARLARREIVSLVVEGGPALHGAFWRAGLVDRVELFVSPRAVGPDGVEWAPMPDGSIASLAELTARPVGDDVRIEGFVLEGSRGSTGSGVQRVQ